MYLYFDNISTSLVEDLDLKNKSGVAEVTKKVSFEIYLNRKEISKLQTKDCFNTATIHL